MKYKILVAKTLESISEIDAQTEDDAKRIALENACDFKETKAEAKTISFSE